MNRFCFLVLSILMAVGLAALPPQFSVSVPPTSIRSSFYDYMPGGYMDTPVVVQTPETGGDIYMIFHCRDTAVSERKIRLARISQNGNLELDNSYSLVNRAQGYPSITLDETSGIPLFVWHETINGSNGNNLDVGFWAGDLDGVTIPEWEPVIAIDNPFTLNNFSGNEFVWPSVAIGPSPLANMHRVYVLARNLTSYTTGYNGHNVLLAYRDFEYDDFNMGDIYGPWNYVSIPQLDDWFFNPAGFERQFDGTLICREDGKIYLIGNHSVQFQDQYNAVDRFLTVFVNDSYGESAWRQISVMAEQIPSQVSNTPAGWELNTMVFVPIHSSHFNVIMDSDLRIHYPQLFTAFDIDGNYYPWMYSVRDVVFDTVTENFAIHDLFPQGASPNSNPCYTPWDVNEDHLVDDPEMNLPLHFPFCYYDPTAHSDAMQYFYNLVKITEPNSSGVMACVWSDSQSALLNPALTGPDTYISISPDNGITWLDPIVLNPLENPTPNGTMTFVYPAKKLIPVGNDNQGNPIFRLFLMFFDDNQWGAAALSGSEFIPDGGNVSYMALDITVPVSAIGDHELPQPQLKLSLYPNPFSSNCKIAIEGLGRQSPQLEIYNLKGQKVRSLGFNSGTEITWDGKDDTGHKLAAGIYIAKAWSGKQSAVRKLVKRD